MRTASFSYVSENQLRCAPSNYAGVCLQNTYDYSPFGVSLDGRTVEGDFYSYGYNMQERMDEISGKGNHFTAQFWEYSPRLAKRWNIDPVFYPWQSSYIVNNNNPISFTDPFGLFGSRKDAREYKKEKGINGRITKDKEGIYYIDDIKNQKSYYRDPNYIHKLYREQKDGVKIATLVTSRKNETSENYSTAIDNFQTTLDIAGTIDPTGIVDGINALIYIARGQWVNAGISALAVIPYIGDLGKGGKLSSKLAAKTELKYSDELVKSAQKMYPNKAGKIEFHHITPKYLGGATKGPLVPLDGAYHQVITNEFRLLWPYGKEIPSKSELNEILDQVYRKYPLPPGFLK